MKKIGFIEYYLDEYHANNYPQMIEELSGGEYKVCYAYACGESPREGALTNREWAEKYGIELLESIEEVIEKSDRLIVLSPNNPELHEALCRLPLMSGKLTYVDKTFAPDKETAIRIFEHADKYGTKCFSSSALRFASEWKGIDTDSIVTLYSEGSGLLDVYIIHQLEPIMSLMKSRVEAVMALNDFDHPSFVLKFSDGRYVHLHHTRADGTKFRITVSDRENKGKHYVVESDFFRLFVQAMLEFFDTGVVPVPHEQTIDVIAARAAAIEAVKAPFQWVEV